MLFKSAYADYQVIVRSEAIIYHPSTGVEVNRIPELVANFGRHLGEYDAPDFITGGTHHGAQIVGHFFDSEAAQAEKGWTDEERESVERMILKISSEQPYLVAPVTQEVVHAPKPWPTYDEQTSVQIQQFAAATGLIPEALAYEKENKGRSTLIAELEDLLKKTETVEPELAEISL